MSPWRFLGWTLLVAAFVAAAAERAALSLAQDWGVMAASDVLRVLYPRTLESLQNAMAPFAWNYIVLPVLALPGWLLAGAPGAALVWHYRSRVEESDPLEDSLPLTTYEEIVAAAREADEDDIGLPSKYRDLDEYDPANRQNDDDADAALDSSDVEPAEVVPHSRYIAPLASDWGQPPRR